MDQKQNKTNENRVSLRVLCKDSRKALFDMNGKTYEVLDISEDSVRFKLEQESLPTKGELKFKNRQPFVFTGEIKRVKGQEFVILLKKESAALLSVIIKQDQTEFVTSQKNTSEKRTTPRYEYRDNNNSVTLDGQNYSIIDISKTAIRFRVNKDKAGLQCQGTILFHDGEDFPVEGILLRLMGQEAVLIFSSTGIPDSRIAKEVYESIDDYW